MSILVIVNPISGTGGRPDVVRARLDAARTLLRAHHVDGEVVITERQGHGRELATSAVAAGASLVVAWGGDGTVNEVASVLAFGHIPLGIIPSGSGNGLARELGIPREPAAALAVALGNGERTVDCGELDSRLFFNIAGLGLDARVAHEFAATGLVRRGLRRYVEITARELFRAPSEEHTVIADGTVIRQRMLILAIANGRQYGNGLLIAPRASLDDGLLDVVAVAARHPLVALIEAPLLFLGVAERLPGVRIVRASQIEIASSSAVLYHVDGEPRVGGTRVTARVHQGALRVKVPVGKVRRT